MSKYLRLTSSSGEGKVETNFSEDIKIEKDASIALLNASFSVDEGRFTIDSTNDVIQYKETQGGAFSDLILTKTQYTRANAQDFLDDIQKTLNEQQQENQQNIGNQFQVDSVGGKTQIQSRISPNSNSLIQDMTDGTNGVRKENATLDVNAGNIRLRNTGAAVADHRNYVASFRPWGKGQASHQVRIASLNSNAGTEESNGFIIGLSKVNPKDWILNANLLSQANMGYAIEVNDPNIANPNNQLRIRDGFSDANTFQNATGFALDKTGINATPNANYVEIVRNVPTTTTTGSIQMRLYRASQAEPELLNTTDFEVAEGIDLFPYVILKGTSAGNAMVLNKYKFFVDPFATDVSRFIDQPTDDVTGVGAEPIVVKNRGATRFLTIQSPVIANILGFPNSVLTNIAQTRGEFRAEAPNIFSQLNENPYFVVRLLNMELDSYDAFVKGRFNVVSSFGDNSQNTRNSVFYEASNPIFLKIANSSPRSIRNMKAQILNADLSPVATDGFISLAFLVN